MVENIKIQIMLRSEFWDKPPMIDLLINDIKIAHHTIDQKKYSIEDNLSLELGQPHHLKLRRHNKSDDQCVNSDGCTKDQYVIIDTVIIDGMDVQNLIWDRSWYEPQYPKVWAQQQMAAGTNLETKVKGQTWLSHNGVWNFTFFSPFYKFVISQFRN